jgi:hypothetical protein
MGALLTRVSAERQGNRLEILDHLARRSVDGAVPARPVE